MAKPDNPAEAPVAGRPPRPVQRVHLDALSEARGQAGDAFELEQRASRQLMDDAFDTTRNLEAPDEWPPQPPNGAAAAGSGAAVFGSAVFGSAVSGSAVSVSRVPKLPLASLEQPSTSQLELTPSPVPRVALSPATGAVDISLVPGPHAIGSRNLPTLAAQHLLGRRAPRRAAPAVTLPPPSAPGLPRMGVTLGAAKYARDVRSSRGEIVLGLTIGLGLSILLAGLGQAYLQDDPIADATSAPAELESVLLSARPEAAPIEAGSSRVVPSSESVATSRVAVAGQLSATDYASGVRGVAGPRGAADIRTVPSRATSPRAVSPRAVSPRAVSPRAVSPRAVSPRAVPPRAVPPRAVPPRPSQPVATSPAARGGQAPPAPVSPQGAPSQSRTASTRLTPAESAGLGLDLPL